jgi:hypothetical protein
LDLLDKLCGGGLWVKCPYAIQARKVGSIKPIERTGRPCGRLINTTAGANNAVVCQSDAVYGTQAGA